MQVSGRWRQSLIQSEQDSYLTTYAQVRILRLGTSGQMKGDRQ
jgi:hypothetical protein